MIDLATRLQPIQSAALLTAVPFDLRLGPPLPARAYPYTALVTETALPQAGTEVLATYAIELEDTLATAVIVSLWTDARATDDDALPMGQTNRRGWVGDAFMPPVDAGARVPGSAGRDAWGSRLWLLRFGKATADVLERARFYAAEALDWLVRDGIAARVDVAVQWVGDRADRLAIRPTIWQPEHVRPVYDVLWGTSISRWGQA